MSWAEMTIRCMASSTARRFFSQTWLCLHPQVERELCPPRLNLSSSNRLPFRSFHSSNPRQKTAAWQVSPPQPSTVPADRVASPQTNITERTRMLMRLLPSSVVICTSTAPSPEPARGSVPRAMTASSLTSVSLGASADDDQRRAEYPPVVSFNIKTPSHTLAAIEASREFNVHVLSADRSGAAVANWFTQPRVGKVPETTKAEGQTGTEPETNAFAGFTEETGCLLIMSRDREELAPPVIRGNGILFVMRCRLLRDEDHEDHARPTGGLVRVRDHVVAFGEVLEINEEEALNQSEERDRDSNSSFGLAYADRHYRQLGNTIVRS